MDRALTPEECRAKAQACYRMSQSVIDPAVRTQFLDLMAQWHELAGRIERLHPRPDMIAPLRH
jgi:hypothetical protein